MSGSSARIAAGMTAFYMFRLLFGTFHGECRASEEVKHHIHESPKVMTIPLDDPGRAFRRGRLGRRSPYPRRREPHRAVAGAGLRPGRQSVQAHAGVSTSSGNAFASAGAQAHAASAEMTLMIVSVVIALIGIFIAYYLYIKNPELPEALRGEVLRSFHRAVHNKYFVDEIYEAVFVRGLLALGTVLQELCRRDRSSTARLTAWRYLLGGIGSLLTAVQAGYVQGYAFAMIVGAIIRDRLSRCESDPVRCVYEVSFPFPS